MSQLERGDIFAGSYELLDHIGSGGFAEVWKARYKLGNFDGSGDDVIVAIKVYAPADGLDQDGIRIFQREYAKTNALNHNHLLKAQHFDIYGGSPYLVLPYCAEGSLMSQIIRGGNYTENDVALIMQQISSGLNYLHKKHIAHQDIKPANILVREKNDYVISDFGISTKVRKTIALSGNDAQEANHSAFAPAYAPPERYTSRPTPAGDVFALGVSLYEVCDGDTPYDDTGEAIKQGGAIPYLSNFSAGLNQILRECTALDPESRPTAETLEGYANYYLQNGHWPSDKKEKKSPVLIYIGGVAAALVIAAGAYFTLGGNGSGASDNLAKEKTLIEEAYKKSMAKANDAKTKKDLSVAIAFYDQALLKKPGDAEAMVAKGTCESNLSSYDKLIAEAKELAKNDKTLFEAKGKYKEAMGLVCCKGIGSQIEILDERIALNNKPRPVPKPAPKEDRGKNVRHLISQADTKMDNGDWKGAFVLLKQAKKENPRQCCEGKEKRFVTLAEEMQELEKFAKAREYFNYAKQINPKINIPDN